MKETKKTSPSILRRYMLFFLVAMVISSLAMVTLFVGCGPVASDPTLGALPINSKLDSDNDGLTDEEEDFFGTDKNNSDSDGDGTQDSGDEDTYKNQEQPSQWLAAGLGALNSGFSGGITGTNLHQALLSVGADAPTVTGGGCPTSDNRIYVRFVGEDGDISEFCAELTAPADPASLEAGTPHTFRWDKNTSKFYVKNEEVDGKIDGSLYYQFTASEEQINSFDATLNPTSGDMCEDEQNPHGFYTQFTSDPGGVQWARDIGNIDCNDPPGMTGSWLRCPSGQPDCL